MIKLTESPTKSLFLSYLRITVILVFIAFILFVNWGCGGASANSSSDSEGHINLNEEEIETALESFLKSEKGLFYTNLTDKTFLSETISLRLYYYTLKEDKESFDKCFDLLKDYFISETKLLYWKLNEDYTPAKSNASIDDLRTLKALLLAYKKWSDDRYFETAKELGSAILKYNTYNNILIDSASWTERGIFRFTSVSPEIKKLTLSYADVRAIKLAYDITKEDKWKDVLQQTLGVLSSAIVFSPTELYWGYDPTTGQFNRKNYNEINNFLFINHLIDINLVPLYFVNKLASDIKTNGIITDKNGNENIALYALATLMFLRTNHLQEATLCLKRVESFNLKDYGYPNLYGYAEKNSVNAWSFDNLLLLIALKEYNSNVSE